MHFAGMAQNAARGICARHQRPRSTRHGLGLQSSESFFILFLRGFLLQWLASEESLCCFSFASQTQQPNYAQRPILCFEENPDLKQHENERGAKLSVHSAETGLALTFTGRAALLETIPEARHASTLVLSFDSSFQLHEQAATETEAGTFLHSVL